MADTIVLYDIGLSDNRNVIFVALSNTVDALEPEIQATIFKSDLMQSLQFAFFLSPTAQELRHYEYYGEFRYIFDLTADSTQNYRRFCVVNGLSNSKKRVVK